MLNNLSDNQKRTLALAAMALLALACLCGTLAFTVDMVPANNVLSFGSVKVRVCEYTLNERGEEIPFEANERGDYPDTKAGGSDISRIVRVENAGAQPEYVRARLRMTSVAPDGSSADASGNVGQYFQYFRHKKTVEKSTALFHSGMLIIQQLKYDKR